MKKLEQLEKKANDLLEEIKTLKKDKTYSIGDVFLVDNSYTCFLAQIGPREVCLIVLKTGNRYCGPINVNDPHSITQEELNEMVEGNTINYLEKAKVIAI